LVKVLRSFSVLLSRNDNMRGGLMHLSTVMVLLLLTFGNMLLFTFGLFVLWLAGEIGEGRRIGDGSHE
jgi:hypothetical protein